MSKDGPGKKISVNVKSPNPEEKWFGIKLCVCFMANSS
jgi:hypothetical protein